MTIRGQLLLKCAFSGTLFLLDGNGHMHRRKPEAWNLKNDSQFRISISFLLITHRIRPVRAHHCRNTDVKMMRILGREQYHCPALAFSHAKCVAIAAVIGAP